MRKELALAIVMTSVQAAAWAAEPRVQPQSIQPSGRLIAKPNAAARGVDATQGLTLIRHDADVGEFILRVPAGETDAAAAARLAATGLYEYVHPDYLVSPAIVPNDTLYPSQWHMPRMGFPAAWDITTGSPSVVVGVCDSGIDLGHPDFASVLVPGYNAVDDLDQASGGQVAGLNDHGTEAAGCVGAVGNNGVGVAGAGWNLRIMPIRVSNQASGNAFLSDINRGARWAVDHGAKVVNISYSGVSNPTNSTTGRYLKDRGAMCVWAAGNANTIAAGTDLPDLIVVGATTSSNTKASFSNYGPAIDVVAPGVGIWMPKIDGWAANDGTSFSAPLVAGAIALAQSVNASWGPVQLEYALKSTTLDLGTQGRDDTFGNGLVDAGRLVRLASDALTQPFAPVALADSGSVYSGDTADIDVLANDIDLNGDALTITAFDQSTPAGPVTLVVGPDNRQRLRVAAGAAYTGVFTVHYSIADATGLTSNATLTMAASRRPAVRSSQVVLLPSNFGNIERIRAVDLDGDGDLDILAGNEATLNSVSMVRNDNGTFMYVGAVSLPTGAKFFDAVDFNGDGLPDIAACGFVAGQVAVSLATAPFTYAAPTTITVTSPMDITATLETGPKLDTNADGNADIAIINGSNNSVEVLLGNGQGGFSAPVRAGFAAIGAVVVRAAYLNADARPDFITASTGNIALTTFLSTGPGTFANFRNSSLPIYPSDLAIINADGTGLPDVIVLSKGLLGDPPGVAVMRSRGTTDALAGFFEPMTFLPATASVAITTSDANADGIADVIVGDATPNRASVHSVGQAPTGGLTPFTSQTDIASSLLQITSARSANVTGSAGADIILGGSAIGPFSTRAAVEILENTSRPDCLADFDADGFSDGFDYDLYVACFEGNACVPGRSADIDHDGFVDGFDYDAFVTIWQQGCP